MTVDTVSVKIDNVPDDSETPAVVVVETPSDTSDISAIDVVLVERVTRLEAAVETVAAAAVEATVAAEEADATAEYAVQQSSDAVDIAISAETEAVAAVEETTAVAEETTDDSDEQNPKSVSHPYFRAKHEWRG